MKLFGNGKKLAVIVILLTLIITPFVFGSYTAYTRMMSELSAMRDSLEKLQISIEQELSSQNTHVIGLELSMDDLEERLTNETVSLRAGTATDIARLDTRVRSGLKGLQGSIDDLSSRPINVSVFASEPRTPAELGDLGSVHAKGEGDEAFDKGNFAQAAVAYGKVVAYEPDNSAAKLSLAVARYRANPVDSDLRTKARGGLEGALEADPSNVMALEQLAFIRTEEGQWDAARNLYERRLGLEGPGAETFERAGLVAGFLKDFARSAEYLKKAVAIEPANPEYAYETALAFDRLGDTEEAVAFYSECLKLNPSHEGAMNGLRAHQVDPTGYAD